MRLVPQPDVRIVTTERSPSTARHVTAEPAERPRGLFDRWMERWIERADAHWRKSLSDPRHRYY